jgi:transcription initiation factor TFIID subunit 2
MAAKLALSVEFLSRAFGFINWYLSATFPYPSYYCVFLHKALSASESASVANISLFSTLALFNNTIIDQNLKTRSLISAALTEQFFGVRLRAEGSASRWLTQGISGFLTRHMLRIFHGNNDFRYNLKRSMATLLAADTGHGPIVDVPDVFANPVDEDWLRLKSCLIMIVFEHRLEKGTLQKVFASCLVNYCIDFGPYLERISRRSATGRSIGNGSLFKVGKKD